MPNELRIENHNGVENSSMGAMLKAMVAAMKLVADKEIMPRYMRVAHQQKYDGSLCTEADIAAQEALIQRLQAIHNVPVLGEEMDAAQQEKIWGNGKQELWCIDPLDGTSNFVHGLPYFAVSVALIRDGKSVLGVVYDPVAKEVFAAERGRGAFLNGVKMQKHSVSRDLSEALANVDLKRLSGKLASTIASKPPFASQRNFGASTLDWCYTAAGRYDAYLHGGQKLWDYAAGSLVLEEAGGHICCLEHDDFSHGDVWQRSVIAALNEQMFNAWKSWIRSHQ
jgi:myo-inositol-1(or 4)-monophosphatase